MRNLPLILAPTVMFTLGPNTVVADTNFIATIIADGISAKAAIGSGRGRHISADGRFVVFESIDSQLIDGGTDDNALVDVFVFDRQTGETMLVSHSAASMTETGAGASDRASISADGRFVVFQSDAADLIAGMVDNNGSFATDIFLWERATGMVRLVSHRNNEPLETGEEQSSDATISDDGNEIAYQSESSDLSATSDSNGELDVFLFDALAPASSNTTLLSGGNDTASDAIVSGDGQFVVFESQATDLVPGSDTNGTDDILRWQRSDGSLVLISHRAGMPTTTGDGRSRRPSISRDGAVIAFESTSEDLLTNPDSNGDDDVFVWRQSSGELMLASQSIDDPDSGGDDSSGSARVSADGSHVVFESDAEDLVADASGGNQNLFLLNVVTGDLQQITQISGASGDADSRDAVISDDGSAVAFKTSARNLTGIPDDNNAEDALLWTAASGISLLNLTAAGLPSAPLLRDVDLSGDGLTAVFDSTTSELADGANGGMFAVASGQAPELLSRRPPRANSGSDLSTWPDRGLRQISDDGRWLVFTSGATDLIHGQNTRFVSNIYLLDLQDGSLRLVSHEPGEPLAGGNSTSELPELSADGSRIVFRSRASNLAPGVPPGFNSYVYLYDVASDQITLITHRPGQPTVAATGMSENPRISADGSTIVFDSTSTLLSSEADPNFGLKDVFLYDVALATATRLTTTTTGPSTEPMVSDDGQWITFVSGASDLSATNDTNGVDDLFLFDRSTATTMLISHRSGDPMAIGDGAAANPSMSGDGRLIAFETTASNLFASADANGAASDIVIYDRADATTTLASHTPGNPQTTGDLASTQPALSRDGSALVFTSLARDLTTDVQTISRFQVFHFDTATATVRLVSQTPAGEFPDSHSREADINDNGRWVTFASNASDLTADPNGNGIGGQDIYLAELASGAVQLVSRRFDGTATMNGASATPTIAADGSVVVYSTTSTDAMRGVSRVQLRGAGRADIVVFDRDAEDADLTVSLTAQPAAALPARDVQIEATVSNLQAGEALRLTLILEVPAGAALVGADAGWSCRQHQEVIICVSADPLGQDSTSAMIDLTMPDESGPYDFLATVKTLVAEQNVDNNDDALTILNPSLDYGDAPAPYPTTSADDGARHALVGSLMLGPTVDAEADGQPDPAAAGDDIAGDDEDGVVLPAMLTIGVTETVTINASQPALLDAWIDLDLDGDWADSGEKIVDSLAVLSGDQPIDLAIPVTATAGASFLRFRLSSAGTLTPTGPADDGEVEDYAIDLVPAPLDFGDAPASYGTAEVDDGARHRLTSALHLGAAVDAEPDGAPSADASSDDLAGLDDEDGVVFTTPLVAGQEAQITVTSSAAGILDAWLDLDVNGTFEASERVIEQSSLVSGSQANSLQLSPMAAPGTTFMRFRVSTNGSDLPTGVADDGEVEDYRVEILPPPAVAISDVMAVEGDAGTSTLPVTVSLTGTTAQDVMVDYSTVDATATVAAADYVGNTGTLLLDNDDRSATIMLEILGDDVEEPDEMLQLVLSNPINAVLDNGEAGVTIVDDDDLGPPQVLAVGALTQGSSVPIPNCSELAALPTTLEIRFDQTMRDAPGDAGSDDASNPANYRLTTPGPDHSFAGSPCVGSIGDDEEIPLTDLMVESAAEIVTVRTGADVSGLARLSICGDLTDLHGNLLGGETAAPTLFDVRITPSLLENGHFDNCRAADLSPWRLLGDVAVGSDDAQGSADSGSALFTVHPGSNSSIEQCILGMGNVLYELSATARGDGLELTLGCDFFEGSDCTGEEVAGAQSGTIDLTASWEPHAWQMRSPPSTQSALCRVAASTPIQSGMVFADAVALIEPELFRDGFEEPLP